MIGRRERLRFAVVFGGLAFVALAVLVRLGDLQIVRPAFAGVRGAPLRRSALPAPRGVIVDRNGERLAYDRRVYEVRVEVGHLQGMPTEDDDLDLAALHTVKERIVADLLWALGQDRTRFTAPQARDDLRELLDQRVAGAMDKTLGAGRKVFDFLVGRQVDSRARRDLREALEEWGRGEWEKVWKYERMALDFLVERQVDDGDAILALRSLDQRAPGRRGADEDRGYQLFFHMLPRFERVYAEPERASGVVGRVVAGPYRESQGEVEVEIDDRLPVSGLERLAILLPGEDGEIASLRDGLNRALYTDRRVDPAAGVTLHTTLDRALQRRADLEIGRAADAVTEHYGHPPEWGGMVLVDVRTGGIVAAASYTAAEDGSRRRFGAFAPTRRLFPPGSVVKPLHLALALERGVISWNDRVDCSEGYRAGEGLVEPLPGHRTIVDSHPNGVLSVRDVLVRSSNIGAIRLGLQLGPEGLEEYLQRYQFGSPTGVRLPGELGGSRPGPIPELRFAEQYVWAGPSVLFGYQIQVSMLQVARAYLTFLSGRQRTLRIADGVEVDGRYRPLPAEAGTERFLSPGTLDTVKDALVGVVEDEHGTARRVGTWLRKLRTAGQVDLEIGGKTGTSQYEGSGRKWNGEPFVGGDVRTSLFVGFTPVREPRYLVVSVLQKAGAGSFYGGTYAAPAASRLLVEALKRETTEPATRTDRSGSLRVVGGTEPGGSGHRVRR